MATTSAPERRAALTDKVVRSAKPDPVQRTEWWDGAIPGLSLRITPSGVKTWGLTYRNRGGRKLRLTLGTYPDLSLAKARRAATVERERVRVGADPATEKRARREAATVAALAERYLEEHARVHKRPACVEDDERMLTTHILPRLGARKVADVTGEDLAALHRKMKATPYRANRVLALCSKMFSLAVEWTLRTDNPAKGVKRFEEDTRTRWLSQAELGRLAAALAAYGSRTAADAIRFLIVTGARRSEALRLRWEHLDLDGGRWTRPAHTVKQAKTDVVPLNAAALALLRARREATNGSPWVFPGRLTGEPLTGLKRAWGTITKAAELDDVRLHDLRHTFASHLVSRGESLHVVGALLGHTRADTTMRYAHLADAATRRAAEQFPTEVLEALPETAAEPPASTARRS